MATSADVSGARNSVKKCGPANAGTGETATPSTRCAGDGETSSVVQGTPCGFPEMSPTVDEGDTEEDDEEEEGGEARFSSQQQLRLPAGTPEERALPSRGSSRHEAGGCSPCVWNWKPQGCHRGRDCGYCHLCPDGEIKNRKKAKLATIRAGSSTSLSFEKDEEFEEQRQGDTSRTSAASASTPANGGAISLGSALHAEGECKPCESQGCQNGAACEVKSRKRGKTEGQTPKDREEQLSMATPVSAKAQPLLLDIRPPPGLPAPPPASTRPWPSVGSKLHGSGECRPCAWFHKPQGCQNAAECRHCHVCPEGAIKLRRKAKASALRSARSRAADSDEEDSEEDSDEEQQQQQQPVPVGQFNGSTQATGGVISLPFVSRRAGRGSRTGSADNADGAGALTPGLPSIGSSAHGSGNCRPCAWFHKPQGCQNGEECRHCHLCPEGEIKDRRRTKVATMKHNDIQDDEPDFEQAFWVAQKQQEALMAAAHWQAQAHWEAAAAWETTRQVAEAAEALLTPMSVWTPSVVAASAAMASAAAMAQQTPLSQLAEVTPSTISLAGAASPSAAASSSPLGSPLGGSPVKVSAEAFPTTPVGAVQNSPAAAPALIAAASAGNLPSAGSSLHELGQCRPCAWFWKPQGCQNGQACAHCHLCPKGELKERKRVKETAMRMGALVPVRQGLGATATPLSSGGTTTTSSAAAAAARTPRVVKIAPILGA